MMRKKVLSLLLSAAMVLALVAAFPGLQTARANGFAPSSVAPVTAKPQPQNNLFNGTAAHSLSRMTGDRVQETSGWYATTLGWTVWPDCTQLSISKVTDLNDPALDGTTTGAKMQYNNAAANEADNNFILYCAQDAGDSPVKLGGLDPCIMYFSAMVKVDQTTWFDIAIENTAGTGAFYDLGRRFKVEPSDGWKEIGKDQSGNYLPFRKPDTIEAAGAHSANSSARSAEFNADENRGSVYFALPYGDNRIKIYTYTTETGPTNSNGLTGNASYFITNVYMWKVEADFDVKVGTIGTRSRVFLSTQEGSQYNSITLTPEMLPQSATNKALNWESDNESVATVENGTITAVAPGTCNVTVTAADGGGASKVIAVTVYDSDDNIYITPDKLEPMTRIGQNVMKNYDGDFSDAGAILGRAYGVGWTFTHPDEMVTGALETAANWEKVNADGLSVATRALKITNNGNTNHPLYDALTFSGLHEAYDINPEEHIYYFSCWVKVEKETWFDITISYSDSTYLGKHYEGQHFYDLGRKFKVTPEMGWVEIGKDENGNFLPFRTHGTGVDPGINSSSYNEQRNANESMGNSIINLPGNALSNVLNWGCIRIWAYGADAEGLDENGIGIPNRTGFSSGDSYYITAVSFWGMNTEPPYVPTLVNSITLSETEVTLQVGQTKTLTAQVEPENADDKSLYWSSSDNAIASVDQNGKITALAEGTVTITAEANDGSGVTATCTVNVTLASTPGPTQAPQGKGCKTTVADSLMIATALFGALLVIKKKNFGKNR